jgi:site-specific recombinase
MLADLHPWRSPTLPFAAVAGVLLFASGIVSGWIENWNRYRRIPERVAHHPWLIAVLRPRGAQAVANGIDKKLGAVVGNVFLGFGLGSMGTLGEILGLPLGIRHIAFASAELGTSLEILGAEIPPRLLLEVGLGVALIGLINFLVSFGLSLVVALESRGVTFRETRLLVRHLGERLMRRPLDWFFPPKTAGA